MQRGAGIGDNLGDFSHVRFVVLALQRAGPRGGNHWQVIIGDGGVNESLVREKPS